MRIQHDLIPNSDAWDAYRLDYLGASESAAMLGISKKVMRDELLKMKCIGSAKVFSDWLQKNILDKGHEVEALARPIAEEIIGEELFPSTFSRGKLSVTCDGITIDDQIAWEHKLWNAELVASVTAGVLPDEHQPQCQQCMLVTGAKRLLFMVSDGTKDNCIYMWVDPDKSWIKRIKQGAKQFHEDKANYKHIPAVVVAVAEHIDNLPMVLVEVQGRVMTTNLEQYSKAASEFIENINTDLKTDDDFANAEKTVKFCTEEEKKLKHEKERALSKMVSIDEVFRMIDKVSEQLRAKRLQLDKLVKTKKEDIRAEIIDAAKYDLREYLCIKNSIIGKPYMPIITGNFLAVMSGKKTLATLRNAANTELAACKIKANEAADLILQNMASMRELADGYQFLFADTAQIVLKENDDLVALVKLRIAEHKEAEAKKEAARKENERIAEAAERIAIEQARVNEALASITSKPGLELPVVTQPAINAPIVALHGVTRPTDYQIICVLAMHYCVSNTEVIKWLLNMDFQDVKNRIAKDS